MNVKYKSVFIPGSVSDRGIDKSLANIFKHDLENKSNRDFASPWTFLN